MVAWLAGRMVFYWVVSSAVLMGMMKAAWTVYSRTAWTEKHLVD